MKSKKNIIAISAASFVILATSVTAFATTAYTTPASVLDEFKVAILEAKKECLYVQVADGTITQEKADEIINTIEENQANCDGTQSQAIGKNAGARLGSNGTGAGSGCGNSCDGKGNNCSGMGGKGLQRGSCCTVN